MFGSRRGTLHRGEGCTVGVQGSEQGEYVAFDLETTGLDPSADEILEIALVRFAGGEPRDEWCTLVKPSRSVPLYVLRLTGIQERELNDAPSIGEILGDLRGFIGDLPLVGHNSSFDVAFLGKLLSDIGDRPCYDTLELARILLPGLFSYRLSSLCNNLGIPLVSAHRALDDAKASGLLFQVLKAKAAALDAGVSSFVRAVMGDRWVSREFFRPGDNIESGVPVLKAPATASSDKGAEDTLTAASVSTCVAVSGQRAQLSQDGPTLFSRSNTELAVYSALAKRPGPVFPGKEEAREEWERAVLVQAPETQESLCGILGACITASKDTGGEVIVAYFDSRTGAKMEKALGDLGGSTGTKVKFFSSPRRSLCMARWRILEKMIWAGVLDDIDLDTRRSLATVANWLSNTRTGSFREVRVSGSMYHVLSEVQARWYPACAATCNASGSCFSGRTERSGVPGVVVTQMDDLVSGEACPTGLQADLVVVGFHRMLDWYDRRADVFEPRRARELLRPEQGRVFAELEARLTESLSKKENTVWSSGRQLPGDLLRLLVEGRRVLDEYAKVRAGQDEEMKSRLSVSDIPGHLPFVGRDIERAEDLLFTLDRMLSPEANTVLVYDQRYAGSEPVLVLRRSWVRPGREMATTLGTRIRNAVFVSPLAGFLAGRPGYGKLLALPEVLPVVDAGAGSRPGNLLTVFVDGLPATKDKEGFEEKSSSFVVDLTDAVREGCLVLTPFASNAQALLEKIAPLLEPRGVLAVLSESPQRTEEYLSQPGTVVVSRLSAFDDEGFAGAKCVVLVKLPFFPPRPEDEARELEVRKAGGDYFREVTLTGVLSKLAQVVDALRNESGPRVLVVLDPRARPAGSSYGAEAFRVLAPDKHVVCPPLAAVGRIRAWLLPQPQE